MTADSKTNALWALLRLGMGWIFLWAFLDKVFGLGFGTEAGKSWLDGVSPASGFLEFGSSGPFAEIFKGMAGSPLVDWLFMLGLLGIGAALILGIGVKIAGYAGAFLMLLMWLAVLPKEHNPFMDEHVIYLLVLLMLPRMNAGGTFGLGKWWSGTSLVKNNPFLL